MPISAQFGAPISISAGFLRSMQVHYAYPQGSFLMFADSSSSLVLKLKCYAAD